MSRFLTLSSSATALLRASISRFKQTCMSAARIRFTQNTQLFLLATPHLIHSFREIPPTYPFISTSPYISSDNKATLKRTTYSYSQYPSSLVSSSSPTFSKPVDPVATTPNFLLHQSSIRLLYRPMPAKIIIISKRAISHPKRPSYAPSSPSQCKPPVPSTQRSKPSIPTLSTDRSRP